MAAPSRFCVFWIRNTIRNVTMVVPVLMTSCHVSEKPKNGRSAHITMRMTLSVKSSASRGAGDRVANFVKNLEPTPTRSLTPEDNTQLERKVAAAWFGR